MGAKSNPPRGHRRRRAAGWLVPCALLAAVLVVGVPAAGADGPATIKVIDGSGPGTVKVEGTNWSGMGGVWLYQCSDTPQSEDDYWSMCDPSTATQVDVDPPWTKDVETKAVITSGEPGFPPGTENWIGNHTYDCEAAGANCLVFAQENWQMSAWDAIPFATKYGPLGKATVSGPTSELTDGQFVTVDNRGTVAGRGHRPGTQAMAYICAGFGYAFPGSCDPIPASELTIPTSGPYEGIYHNEAVPLPRFVWVNDPFDHGDWYDCAGGCSVVVASADNLVSPYWEQGVDQLLRFRAEPLEKNPQLLTVTRVLVNRLGGITIAGRIDCTQAIAQWGQSAFQAGVNVSWKARQPIGRKGAVTAHYESAIASLCHDPSDTDPATPPYPWATHPPITSSEIWWVYPDAGGKFTAGAMHVDVQVTGGPWSKSPGADQYILTGVTQWDGKAVKG